jgi:vacuolar-type H+-ATPase subunit I/STV1
MVKSKTTIQMKKNLIESLGIIVILIGVLMLALPGFGLAGSVNNNMLMGGGLFVLFVGLIVHIIVTKKASDK